MNKLLYEKDGYFGNSEAILFRLSKKMLYLYLVWFFSLSQFSPIEINIFNKNFVYPIYLTSWVQM